MILALTKQQKSYIIKKIYSRDYPYKSVDRARRNRKYMSYFRISLAGDLGSGKSTVGQILQKRFCADVISIGKIQREMAEKLGMDTTEFNQYQESHPELDKELDDRLAAYEKKEGSYIFDSRMAWYFVPSAFSVYLKCNPEESAERVLYAKRIDETYQSPEEAFKRLKERRESEVQRYKKFYGVDIMNMTNYALVIDTTGKSPEAVAEEIVLAWAKTLNLEENAKN